MSDNDIGKDIPITQATRDFLVEVGKYLAATNEEAVEMSVMDEVGVQYDIVMWFAQYPMLIEVDLEDKTDG